MRDIKDLSFEELGIELIRIGEPSYRAGQIFDWIYKKGAVRFEDMTNLGRDLQEKLDRTFRLGTLELSGVSKSVDRAEKNVFRLRDGSRIETVLIPTGDRATVCVSTQVGCKFACAFCASGRHGFVRHLAPSEIVGQVLFLRDHIDMALTNIVFMGMGEPFDNYENLVKAVVILNSRRGLGIAARRMTVSTAGIIPGIERFAKLGLQVNLSVSIHATTDARRSALMPLNKKYPLENLLAACENYLKEGGRKITLEYVLLDRVNDTAEDASRLARIASRLKAKVNLIPFSPIAGISFDAPEEARARDFRRKLEDKGVPVTLRHSKGRDIQAACGQLTLLE